MVQRIRAGILEHVFDAMSYLSRLLLNSAGTFLYSNMPFFGLHRRVTFGFGNINYTHILKSIELRYIFGVKLITLKIDKSCKKLIIKRYTTILHVVL